MANLLSSLSKERALGYQPGSEIIVLITEGILYYPGPAPHT